MKRKCRFEIGLVLFILMFGAQVPLVSNELSGTPTVIQARRTRKIRHHRTKRVRHRRKNVFRYLVGRHSLYLLSNYNFKQLKSGSGYSARSGIPKVLVRVLKRAWVAGDRFDRVTSHFAFDRGWVYHGNLSRSRNGRAHGISLKHLLWKVDSRQSGKTASRRQIADYLWEMQNQTLNDLNAERHTYGLSQLSEATSLDQVAGERAQQIASDFTHYDPQGNPYYLDDAKQLGVNLAGASGENIADAGLGRSQLSGRKYFSRNGNDMANMDNNGMMYHDAGSHWGHRENILNRDFHYVGIGTYHDPNQNMYYLAEDFSE